MSNAWMELFCAFVLIYLYQELSNHYFMFCDVVLKGLET